MNFGAISRVLAGFVAFFTVAHVVPLLLAISEPATPRGSTATGFVASMAVGAVVAGLLWLGGRKAPPGFYRRETLFVAGIAWVVASVLASLPLQWSGLLPDPVEALFESVSGLTTCGATMLGSADNPSPEATPGSLLLWRALLHWVGGIGIMLIFVALLPSGAASKNLLIAESVGVAAEGYQPRLLQQARWVVGTYVILSAACVGALKVVGAMTWLEATCHAFATIASGGYSTRTSIAHFDSVGTEVVLTVFMFIGGCSFTVMAGVLRDGWPGFLGLLRTGEFRIYSAFTLLAIGLVQVDLVRGGRAFDEALRMSSFNVVSMLTSTGFATVNFHAWPPLSLLVIFACTMIGGCSGSAAGGMKQVRLLVCLRLLTFTLRSFVQPKRVDRLRLDGEVMQAATVSSVLAIVLLWLLSILVGAVVIAFDQRLSFIGALTASAAMLGNTGPSLPTADPAWLASHGLPAVKQAVDVIGPDIGPFGGYAVLAGWTQLVMCFEMILGRLEILPVLALLSPGFWRR